MNFEQFKKSIYDIPAHKIVFVGLGNIYREDDAGGIIFLHELMKDEYFSDSHFIDAGTTPENYIHNIIDIEPSLVIFIDTVRQNGIAKGIEWLNSDYIEECDFSTHAYPIKLLEKYIKMYINTNITYLIIPFNYSSEIIFEFFSKYRPEDV